MRIALLKEPDLFFGNNSKCLDPQVGLLNFGPYGGSSSDGGKKISVRAGIVGTKRSIDKTKIWLDTLKFRIGLKRRTKTEYKGIDFPRLRIDSPLGFRSSSTRTAVRKLKEPSSEVWKHSTGKKGLRSPSNATATFLTTQPTLIQTRKYFCCPLMTMFLACVRSHTSGLTGLSTSIGSSATPQAAWPKSSTSITT